MDVLLSPFCAETGPTPTTDSHYLDGVDSTPGVPVPLKVREIIKLIEADGWRLSRTNGSHRQYVHPTKPGVVTIAGKPSRDLPPGLERSILKQAGL